MKPLRLAAVLAASAGLAACVTPHQEDAKVRMPWPASTPAGLLAYAEPKADYPTVGGDILKGTAPSDQAIAAQAGQPAPQTPPPPR